MNFKKIIIWGYKPPMRHTHHSIHVGFYKGFKELGFETLWLDNEDDVSNINFDDSLFFTEGQVDAKIPINLTSKYILHNCNWDKYNSVPTENKIGLQFFHKEVLGYANHEKINDWTFIGGNTIYTAWATDLLPREINVNEARNELNNKECVWIGSYSQGDKTQFENNTQLDPFFNACRRNGVRVTHIDPWSKPVSFEENKRLVNQAYVAPAINGWFQRDIYYLPCRLFKSISYGALGITNNEYANKIFDNQLIFDTNTENLFYKAVEKKNNPNVLDYIKSLMNEVKQKHTYVNRAQVILGYFK